MALDSCTPFVDQTQALSASQQAANHVSARFSSDESYAQQVHRLPIITHQRSWVSPRTRIRGEDIGNAGVSQRLGTACSSGSQQAASSAGFISGGGRVSFSRRTARLKKSQYRPAVFDPIAFLARLPIFSNCSIEFVRCLQDLGGHLGA